MTPKRIRTLIVDDEPLGREAIRELLAADDVIDIIGECCDGKSGIEALRTLKPDLLFLDVQMPDMDAFGVIGAIGVERMPVTIFVTAYDKYAVKGFEARALDYVLKPFDEERFAGAVARAKQYIRQQRQSELGARLLDLFSDQQAPRHLHRLIIKSAGKVLFLNTKDIDWVEAAGNYLKLHVGQQTHLFRSKISDLEAKLDSRRFVRIHRSVIVNIDRIKELQPWYTGEYAVVLRDGKELTLSRGYRNRLRILMGNLS